MKKLSFQAKQTIAASNRRENYIASLKLEGISVPANTSSMTREQLIAAYRQKAQSKNG
ncbi:MAG: YhfG family protein [Deefgea sp.]